MDSFIFLARLCPSLPIIWKLFWLVVWPVWLLWWWITGGPSGALCIFHQRSWRFPLCTHHHSLGPLIGTNRWHHFGWPLGLCPWGRPEGFDGSAPFEVSLDAIPTTDHFDTFTKTLCVGYDNMLLVLLFMVSRLGIIVAPIIDLPGRPVESFLHLVQSPRRIFTVGESLPEVLLFFLEQLRIAAHGGGPVGEGLDNTEFGWEVMVAVPL